MKYNIILRPTDQVLFTIKVYSYVLGNLALLVYVKSYYIRSSVCRPGNSVEINITEFSIRFQYYSRHSSINRPPTPSTLLRLLIKIFNIVLQEKKQLKWLLLLWKNKVPFKIWVSISASPGSLTFFPFKPCSLCHRVGSSFSDLGVQWKMSGGTYGQHHYFLSLGFYVFEHFSIISLCATALEKWYFCGCLYFSTDL